MGEFGDTLYFDPSTGKLSTDKPHSKLLPMEKSGEMLYFNPGTGKLSTDKPHSKLVPMEEFGDTLYFDPSTGKLSTDKPHSKLVPMEEFDDMLYFHPSTGKLSTDKPHSKLVPMEEFGDTLYFDPSTGKLVKRRPEDPEICTCNTETTPGFFGGCPHSAVKGSLTRCCTSREFSDAVNCLSPDKYSLREYYKIQSLQSLGARSDRVYVPIWIAQEGSSRFLRVAPAWKHHLQQAIKHINDAAPGLHLYITSDMSEAKVRISGNDKKGCYTRGNILTSPGKVEVRLDGTWQEMRRTSCHELLHALALGHEHQRRDRAFSVGVESEGSQYKNLGLLGITRFDPFSIMLYPEDDHRLRRSGDPVWFTKRYKALNREMSELDKVGLNNLYRPCTGPTYSPAKGVTGLWYCGRTFGLQYDGHDGRCGPTNGNNCPACRVLKTDKVVSLWRKGKWQGWTGGCYCGRYFGIQCEGHDGYCGPNNGPPCPQCYKELLNRS